MSGKERERRSLCSQVRRCFARTVEIRAQHSQNDARGDARFYIEGIHSAESDPKASIWFFVLEISLELMATGPEVGVREGSEAEKIYGRKTWSFSVRPLQVNTVLVFAVFNAVRVPREVDHFDKKEGMNEINLQAEEVGFREHGRRNGIDVVEGGLQGPRRGWGAVRGVGIADEGKLAAVSWRPNAVRIPLVFSIVYAGHFIQTMAQRHHSVDVGQVMQLVIVKVQFARLL